MNDMNYTFYQLIDQHPIIFVLMLTVVYMWANGKNRECLVKEIKGDKSARFHGSLYSLAAIWVMVGVFQTLINHWPTITGNEETYTYYHGHRYDIVSLDSLHHSALCGCKQQNRYLPHETLDSLTTDTTQSFNPKPDNVVNHTNE